MDPNGAQRVGVLGVGTMGAGIVQLAAQTGHEVVACDRSVEAIEKAQLYVRDGLSRFAGRDAFSEEEAEEHYERIHWTVNLEEMAGVGAAIEAIVEKVGPKKEAFAALDEILSPEALLLTNTSSISITDLASATPGDQTKSAGRTSSPRRPSGRRSRCHAASSRATRPSRRSGR